MTRRSASGGLQHSARRHTSRARTGGFTLLEIVVVLALFGLITALLIGGSGFDWADYGYLTDANGYTLTIDRTAGTITVAGRGEREPWVASADEQAEARNRRVEIKLR